MSDIKKLEGVSQQICFYAKGWYGKGKSIKEDLRAVIARYSNINPEYIPDRDIMQLLCETFSECVKNPFEIADGIFEITGEKWKGFSLQREPEAVLIGKISICHGKYIDLKGKMDFTLKT